VLVLLLENLVIHLLLLLTHFVLLPLLPLSLFTVIALITVLSLLLNSLLLSRPTLVFDVSLSSKSAKIANLFLTKNWSDLFLFSFCLILIARDT